jgi:hypothetical protein
VRRRKVSQSNCLVVESYCSAEWGGFLNLKLPFELEGLAFSSLFPRIRVLNNHRSLKL